MARILASHGFDGPEPDGEGYALYLADDQSVRIRGGELNGEYPITGFAVEIISLEVTDDILRIMLELARNGNLAFTSVVGDKALLVDRLDDEKSQQRWPDAKIVQTTADLRRWLIDEIGGRQVLSFVP